MPLRASSPQTAQVKVSTGRTLAKQSSQNQVPFWLHPGQRRGKRKSKRVVPKFSTTVFVPASKVFWGCLSDSKEQSGLIVEGVFSILFLFP